MSAVKAYSYQIMSYLSEGDWVHGDYIILTQFYIPSENLQYHFHQNYVIIGSPIKYNNEEDLHLKNKIFNGGVSECNKGNIYNLKQIELKPEFIEKLKKYMVIEKSRKELFNELKDYPLSA
jgi:hypothetical protein